MSVVQRARRAPASPTGRSGVAAAAVVDRARMLLLAALAGALAAVLSCMVLTVPVALAWFADERSTTSLWQTLGVGADLWALAHRGSVLADGARVTLAPLLLTLVPLLACRYAVGQVLVDRPGTGGRAGKLPPWRAAWQGLGGAELCWFVAGYVAAGSAMATLTGLGAAQVQLGSTVPGLLLVPVLAVLLALRAEHRQQQQPSVDRALRWAEANTPVLVQRALRPAAEAVLGMLVAGLLVVVALLVVHGERVVDLYASLDAGAVGLGVLTAVQLAALPNLVVWALGWMAGAEVVVGPVRLDWETATAGDLPLVPVLAGLPAPGPLPEPVWSVVLVPVLAGVWIGVRSVRAVPRLASWSAKARIAVSACALAALAVLVLAWMAAGAMTPGLLGQLGPAPLHVAGLLLAELLVAALATLTLLHLVLARRLPGSASSAPPRQG